MSFGPYEITIGFFVDGTYQFFELFLGLIEWCRVGRLRRCLRAPRSIGQAKLNPTRFGRVQLGLVDFGIELVGAGVGALGVLYLGFASELLIVGLLRERVEYEEDQDGDRDSFHRRILSPKKPGKLEIGRPGWTAVIRPFLSPSSCLRLLNDEVYKSCV